MDYEQQDRIMYEYQRDGRTMTTPSQILAHDRAEEGTDVVRVNLDTPTSSMV